MKKFGAKRESKIRAKIGSNVIITFDKLTYKFSRANVNHTDATMLSELVECESQSVAVMSTFFSSEKSLVLLFFLNGKNQNSNREIFFKIK